MTVLSVTKMNIFRGRTNVGGVTSHVADEGIEMQSDWSSVRSITDSDRGDREVGHLTLRGLLLSSHNLTPIYRAGSSDTSEAQY